MILSTVFILLNKGARVLSLVFPLGAILSAAIASPYYENAELLSIDNGTVKVGIDRYKGASITHLSSKSYPRNVVNIHDPGRLIQQSYYAGKRLDRTSEGQHKRWSPWRWNPIQGGGVSSWARSTECKKIDEYTLYGETIPKLWDMPNEEADAVMKQWTSFEEGIPNAIVVNCQIICKRGSSDQWGPSDLLHQEFPACYFTRNFSQARSYLGNGRWRDETDTPGLPWSKAEPPLKAIGLFESNGQGVAIYSPSSGKKFNFGIVGNGDSDDPHAGPCAHVAPIANVKLGPQSKLSYRYWLILGDEQEISRTLDDLVSSYRNEKWKLSD